LSSRRLIFVTRASPVPATSGATLRTHRLMTGLAVAFDVTLLTLDHGLRDADGHQSLSEAERQLAGIRVLAATGPGTHKRAGQAASLLRRGSWEWSRYARSGLGRLLASEAARQKPALIHFDDPGVGLLGPVEGSVSVFAPHNIEHRILQAAAAASSDMRRLFARIESQKVEREERSLWRSMDLCLAVSDIDAQLMREGGARRVEVCPNGADPAPRLPAPRRGRDEPFRVLLLGTGSYLPHARGVQWFVEEVVPLLRAAGRVEVDVVGTAPARRPEAPQVRYVGKVADVEPWYRRAHAVVIPVFEGSGTRLKVIEAAMLGRPIVSTALGAEGLPLSPGEHYLRAERAEPFADALLRVARLTECPDGTLESMLADARAAVEQLSWPRITARLVSLYEDAIDRRADATRASAARARYAILVTTGHGQPSVAELDHAAACGQRPRRDYVELARLLEADVIDAEYMAGRASPIARLVAGTLGISAGQIIEAFVRRRRYPVIVAWSDRLGLPLALLLKIVRSRRRIVLISILITNRKKAFFLKHLRVQSHIHVIVGRKFQMEVAARELGVPADKIRVEPRGVDDRFWRRPSDGRPRDLICAVGWLERDYATLGRAVEDLPIDVELAVGSVYLPDSPDPERMIGSSRGPVPSSELPPNMHLGGYRPAELRELYSRSRFVVVPVKPVEWDAGVTAITEAMAMGKAVLATRMPGLADLFEDGNEGLFVAPGDAQAWRSAIKRLWAHPDEAARMGRAGRERIERVHRLDDCMTRLAAIVATAAPGG
jgi:glycosyltransferase involved in cell wall biosynthesis